jgi:hypothetical protein
MSIPYCYKVETIPLQSSPVSTLKFNNFLTEQEKEYFRQYTNYSLNREDYSPYISNTYSLFDCDELLELKNKFNKAIKTYTQDVLCASELHFRLVGSWFTKNTLDTAHFNHSHPNAMLSVATYFDDQVDEDDYIRGIVFKQRKFSNIFPDFKFTFDKLEPSEWNIYNYEEYTIRPKHNDVIIFPSHLNHCSEINTTNSRFCIGANYFISGKVYGRDIYSSIEI